MNGVENDLYAVFKLPWLIRNSPGDQNSLVPNIDDFDTIEYSNDISFVRCPISMIQPVLMKTSRNFVKEYFPKTNGFIWFVILCF